MWKTLTLNEEKEVSEGGIMFYCDWEITCTSRCNTGPNSFFGHLTDLFYFTGKILFYTIIKHASILTAWRLFGLESEIMPHDPWTPRDQITTSHAIRITLNCLEWMHVGRNLEPVFVLDSLHSKFNGPLPTTPVQRGAIKHIKESDPTIKSHKSP